MFRNRKRFLRSCAIYVLLINAGLFALLFTKFMRNMYRGVHSLAQKKAREKYLNCSVPVRFGDGYGGWSICRPVQSHLFYGAVVYSIGIGRNIKWDEGMLNYYRTEQHGWDPTPSAYEFLSKRSVPKGFFFHPYGLAVKDGHMTLKLPYGNKDSYTMMEYSRPAQNGTIIAVPMLSLQSMMRKLDHHWLAVLKMDIEGAEFDVIDSWYSNSFEIPADQVLIEFHARYFKHDRGFNQKVPEAITKMSKLNFDLSMRTNLVS